MQYPGIVIDYGHGGLINGAYQTVGGKQYHFTDAPPFSIYEGVINRQVAARLIERLLAARVVVFDCVAGCRWTTPPTWQQLVQQDVPLSSRTRHANRHPDCLVASLHGNAVGTSIRGPSQAPRGASIYTSRGQTQADPIATTLHAAFERAFAGLGVGVRKGDYADGDPDHEADFQILTQTRAPAVLGELLFFTNRQDALFLLSVEGQEVIADAYADGLLPWLRPSS